VHNGAQMQDGGAEGAAILVAERALLIQIEESIP
jgi:hypothetical protein